MRNALPSVLCPLSIVRSPVLRFPVPRFPFPAFRDLDGKVRDRQPRPGGQDDHLLDGVAELADVAGPGVGLERLQGRRLDARDGAAVRGGELLQEARDEPGDVLRVVLQGRHADVDDVQPVVEVFAERAVRHHLREVAVRRGDEPEVDGLLRRAAEAADGLRLDRAEKGDLRRHVDLADLVEEERSAVRLLDAALLAVLEAARERPGLVAEELRLQEVARERRAFDGDERPLRAPREAVDRLRGEFLARAARPLDEDRRVRRGDLSDERVDALHRRRLAREALQLRAELVLELGDLLFEVRRADRLRDAQLEGLQVGHRLLEEVVRPVLHRLDGEIDRAVGREENRRHRGVLGLRLLEELDAALARHLHVGDHQREVGVRADEPQGLGRVRRREAVIRRREPLREHVAQRLFVIDDEDLGLCHDEKTVKKREIANSISF